MLGKGADHLVKLLANTSWDISSAELTVVNNPANHSNPLPACFFFF